MARKDSPKQRRVELSRRLQRKGVKVAIVSNPKHIFYLTGFSTNLTHYGVIGKGQRSTSFLALRDDGVGSLLLGKSELRNPFMGAEGSSKVGDYDGLVVGYDDYDLDVTMLPYANYLAPEMKKWLRKTVLADRPRKVGAEDWHLAEIYDAVIRKVVPESKLVGISEDVLEMRVTKGKDELGCLRQANRILDYAYAAARENAVAGKRELDLFGEMNRMAFEKFGPLALIGGDVVSSARTLEVGGYASNRKLKKGDTIIIDMQVAYNNYWADTARTFVVGRPSQRQHRAHETVVEAKAEAARMLKPGVPTASIAAAVDKFLTDEGYPAMIHHAGHALGLEDQERPWIIRGSTMKVQENQVYVIEPGIYDRSTGGVRVEDCYFVTAGGVEKVSHFGLEL